MIFQREHCKLIAKGKKTQTRRLVKEGDYSLKYVRWKDLKKGVPISSIAKYAVFRKNGKIRWVVGRDYSVQDGRGKYCLTYCENCKAIIEDPHTWYSCCPICGWSRWKSYNGYETNEPPFKPLKIKIKSIKKERLFDISRKDAKKEGGYTPKEFIKMFQKLYKKPESWNPELWVLEFELL